MSTKPLRVLYAASEVAGFAKTGGLADVAGSLPRALAERGIDCAVIMPFYLRELYYKHPKEAVRKHYQAIHSLITVHNLAFQGVFWHLDMPLTGLPWKLFNHEQLEFFGHINFLKGGVVFSDLINTVSP